MDVLQLLAELEGIRDKIPGFLQQEFENLLASIRHTYEMSIKYVTPPPPVHAGKQNLAAHHSTLDGLHTQLAGGLETFQAVYKGPSSDAYHAKASMSLQHLQVMRDHLAVASQQHDTMASSFDTALEAKLALGALLAGLVVTLGVLIGSAGSTAPVTVPAAALEVAGGAASITIMTEAEMTAVAAIMGLIGAVGPEALLLGAQAFVVTEVVEHVALHAPTITLPYPSANTSSPTNNTLPATIKQTDDGQTIRVRILSPNEVKRLKTPWGTKFHDEKQDGGFKATDDIYVDADGNYWIGPHGSDYVTAFP